MDPKAYIQKLNAQFREKGVPSPTKNNAGFLDSSIIISPNLDDADYEELKRIIDEEFSAEIEACSGHTNLGLTTKQLHSMADIVYLNLKESLPEDLLPLARFAIDEYVKIVTDAASNHLGTDPPTPEL